MRKLAKNKVLFKKGRDKNLFGYNMRAERWSKSREYKVKGKKEDDCAVTDTMFVVYAHRAIRLWYTRTKQ